ncbi:MAG: helix-turn-helix domain-containing protein [Lachnospiraceae bacterium]|nr:helix-turn-helix domain-containing protein [Lachnospiraceae bacterium]
MQLNLHENIKKYRREMKLTQEELADAFGVTVGAVSKWESGSTVPDILTLMELADFFNISMDVLLGYGISSKKVDDISDRLSELLNRGEYEEAISEADKALVRYPGNFKILVSCAQTYETVMAVKDSKAYRRKAVELYEASLRYIDQNTDPEYNEFTIKFLIANLKMWENPEESLGRLKEINYMGIADTNIARIYSKMGNYDEALDRYTRTLVSILIRVMEFSTNMYITLISTGKAKSVKEAADLMDWSLAIVDSVSDGKISYLTKVKVMMLILKSLSLSCSEEYDDMKKCIDTAYMLAKEYDKNPSNDFSGKIKFWHAHEDYHPSLYDELGHGAEAGIDHLFREASDQIPEKIIKKMESAKDYWEEIKENNHV